MNETEARVLGPQLMEVSEMVYLTTLQPDGYPHTRALWNLRNRKMFGRLWPLFREHKDDYLVLLSTNTSSNKVAQIEANPRICAYYCDPQDYRGLTLIGDAEIVEEIFLLALSRTPTPQEKQKATEHVTRDPKARTQALQDLMWATLNTKEFLFNH